MLIQAAAAQLFSLPQYSHAYTALVDTSGNVQPQEAVVQQAAELLQSNVPNLVDLVQHARSNPPKGGLSACLLNTACI